MRFLLAYTYLRMYSAVGFHMYVYIHIYIHIDVNTYMYLQLQQTGKTQKRPATHYPCHGSFSLSLSHTHTHTQTHTHTHTHTHKHTHKQHTHINIHTRPGTVSYTTTQDLQHTAHIIDKNRFYAGLELFEMQLYILEGKSTQKKPTNTQKRPATNCPYHL